MLMSKEQISTSHQISIKAKQRIITSNSRWRLFTEVFISFFKFLGRKQVFEKPSVGCGSAENSHNVTQDNEYEQPQNKKHLTPIVSVDRHFDSTVRTAKNYKKYQFKNIQTEKVRPFYLWKDGFIENYKKVSQQAMSKPPVHTEDEKLSKKQTGLSETYQEGFFDSKSFLNKKQIEDSVLRSSIQKPKEMSIIDQQLEAFPVNDYHPLKSSMFNKDQCLPLKKYYYDNYGMIQHSNKQKKYLGIKNYISTAEKRLKMLSLTENFGIYAHQVVEEKEKQKQEEKQFRSTITQPTPMSNAYSLDQQDSTQDSMQKHFYARRQSNQPTDLLIHLNGLTEDGKFECKTYRLDMEIAKEFPKENLEFLKYCEVLFTSQCHLKYIFSADGSPIKKIHKYIANPKEPYEIFVSSYPYFIGQREASHTIEEKNLPPATQLIPPKISVKKAKAQNKDLQETIFVPIKNVLDLNLQTIDEAAAHSKAQKKIMLNKTDVAFRNAQNHLGSPSNSHRESQAHQRFGSLTSKKDQWLKSRSIMQRKQSNGQMSFNDYISSVFQDQEYSDQSYNSFYQKAFNNNFKTVQNKELQKKKKADIKSIIDIDQDRQSTQNDDVSIIGQTFSPMSINPQVNDKQNYPLIGLQDLQKQKFLLETQKIIEKCMILAHKISQINKNTMFSSLLGNWYMKQKTANKTNLLGLDNKDLEFQIYSVLKEAQQVNHQGFMKQHTKTLNEIKKEYMELENDQIRTGRGDRMMVISALFDSEDELNYDRIIDQVRTTNRSSLEQFSKNKFQICLRQSEEKQSEDDNLKIHVNDNKVQISVDINYPKQMVLEQDHFNLIFSLISQSLYSKEELAYLHNIFTFMGSSLGDKMFLQMKNLCQVVENNRFNDPSCSAIFDKLFYLENDSINWKGFLMAMAKLRFEKVLEHIQQVINQHENDGIFGKIKKLGDIKGSREIISELFQHIVTKEIRIKDLFKHKMKKDSSIKQSLNFYPRPNQSLQNKDQTPSISPLGHDIADRISGITNSGDIVKVRDSNYVITEDLYGKSATPMEYTQFAQVSNKIDQSPNLPVAISTIENSHFYQQMNQKSGSTFKQIKQGTPSPFDSSAKLQEENQRRISNKNPVQMTGNPSTSVFNYSLKSFQDQDDEDEELQDSFGENFKLLTKKSNKYQDDEMEHAIYSQNKANAAQLSKNKKSEEHSLYSDDQKKSVFLYSSSNDDIVQSQISHRVSNKIIKNQLQNSTHRNSSKQSIQFLSNIGSSTSVALGGTGSNPHLDGGNTQNNFLFKTNSSNFQLSDMTMSMLKDNTNINNFNPTSNLNTKHFLDTDSYEIKELEEEHCYTPLNQFYDENHIKSQDKIVPSQFNSLPELRGNQNAREMSIKNLKQPQSNLSMHKTNLSNTSNLYPNQQTQPSHTANHSIQLTEGRRIETKSEQISQKNHVDQSMISINEDSFNACDYDEYMEEKCSLQETDEAVSHQTQQLQKDDSIQASYYQTNTADFGNHTKSQSHQYPPRSALQTASVISQGSQGSGLPPKGPQSHQQSAQKNYLQSTMQYTQGDEQEQMNSYDHRQYSHFQSQISQNSKKSQHQIIFEDYENEQEGRQEMIDYLQSDCNTGQQPGIQIQSQQEELQQDDGFIETFGPVDNINMSSECHNDENMFQNQNGEITIENFQNQNYYDNTSNETFDKQRSQDVVERLLERERQKQQKLEQQRLFKQSQELMQLQSKPCISQYSQLIVNQKNQGVPTYLDIQSHMEIQRKKEDLKRIYDQKKLEEVTGKPQISERARSLQRGLDHLYQWQKEAQKKKEDKQKQKEDKERQEWEKCQKQQKYVNKESQKYIQNKENLYATKRIEERLISIGQQNKLKKEKLAKSKLDEQVQLANQRHQKRDRTLSINQSSHKKPEKELSVLSELELAKLQDNRQRKDLFKRYYNEKKKEQESKILSTASLQSAFHLSPQSSQYDVNAISRNNLYSINSQNVGNSMTCLSQANPNPFMTQAQMPLSPTTGWDPQFSTLQFGFNTMSQQSFELNKNANYCSFGSMPQPPHLRQSSQQYLNNYNTVSQNYQPPMVSTNNEIYQQLLKEAKTPTNMTQMLSHVSSQSMASTSCFEQLDSAPTATSTLLPPKFTSKTQTSRTSNHQPNFQKETHSSRNRSKTKEDEKQQPNNQTKNHQSQSPKSNRSNSRGKSNNNMYEKNLKWSKERQRKIEEKQEKINLLNTLKCTFKPNISEKSQKLMSPAAQSNRLRVYEGGSFKQGNHPSNFSKDILFEQLLASQISPLTNNQDSFLQEQTKDPFLEQVAGLNNHQSILEYKQNPHINQNIPVQMKINDSIRQNMSNQYNLKSQRAQNSQMLI